MKVQERHLIGSALCLITSLPLGTPHIGKNDRSCQNRRERPLGEHFAENPSLQLGGLCQDLPGLNHSRKCHLLWGVWGVVGRFTISPELRKSICHTYIELALICQHCLEYYIIRVLQRNRANRRETKRERVSDEINRCDI